MSEQKAYAGYLACLGAAVLINIGFAWGLRSELAQAKPIEAQLTKNMRELTTLVEKSNAYHANLTNETHLMLEALWTQTQDHTARLNLLLSPEQEQLLDLEARLSRLSHE